MRRIAITVLLTFLFGKDSCAWMRPYDGTLDPFTITQAVRLVKMREDVATAKMKVGYPGEHYMPTALEMQWALPDFEEKQIPVKKCNGYYDLGIESIGFIEVSSKSKPKLYVGESIAEMRSNSMEDFEQTTEMKRVKNGCWRSVIPLALRYFRFEGDVADVKFLEHIDHTLRLKGAFKSQDKQLNDIWKASARTIQLCSRHFLLDGVKRDRLPWAGDLSVSLLANAYTFRDQDVVRRSLAVLETFMPTKSDVNGLVDYSLWLIISHDLYQLYFGDMDFLRMQYPSIRCRLNSFAKRAGADGLLTSSVGKIFVDWTDEAVNNYKDGCVASLNVVYKGALDAGVRLAERVGAKEDAAMWKRRSADITLKIRKKYLDENTKLFGPLRYANFYAVVFDVAKGKDELEAIANALAGNEMPPVGTPYCAYWQNVALVKCNRADVAMGFVRKIWGGMLRDGATTFWEGWSEDKKGDEKYSFYKRPFANSLCHAWSASPSVFFAREIAGIKPTSDGWKTWVKNPLPEASGMNFTVPTSQGEIEISIP
jgi:hypothetical protein